MQILMQSTTGEGDARTFETIIGARDYARSVVGESPAIVNDTAQSEDGTKTIRVIGTDENGTAVTLAILFPDAWRAMVKAAKRRAPMLPDVLDELLKR